MTEIIENRTYQNYASPKLCHELMNAGFTPYMETFWRGYINGEMDIVSFVFDKDDYYRDGTAASDMFCKPDYVIGAFTIKDMEQHLPDFCVCRCNKMYEVSLDGNFQVEASKADRLPDAFAMILLAAIKKRVINLEKIKLA